MDIRVQPNSNSCASFQICVPIQAEVTCASGVQLDLDADGDFSSTPAGGEDFNGSDCPMVFASDAGHWRHSAVDLLLSA